MPKVETEIFAACARSRPNSELSPNILEATGDRQTSILDVSLAKRVIGHTDADNESGANLLAALVQDILVRIGDVCTISGLSVPTIYRLMAKGLFPRPVKITASARAWKLSELTAWVETRERGGSL